MPIVALVTAALFFALAFGLRGWLQWRRTGSTGFRGISGAVGSAEWLGGVLFVAAMAGVVLAPVAVARRPGADRGRRSTSPPVRAVGLALGRARASPGRSGPSSTWATRGASASTTASARRSSRAGPFRFVRNPIYTFMTIGLAGLALLTPNAIAAATLVLLVIALELQVRLVEEPYLLRAHGTPYRTYAARVGRFLPGIGRLAPPEGARP